jgi:hypothetical protein
VSVIPSAVKHSPLAERPWPRARPRVAWLIPCGYLAGALVLTWRLWAHPAGAMTSGNDKDIDQYAWFLRYAASAVAHRHFPALVTTALNAPRGVNLMWNTAFLLPGMLLTPVTLLAGPQVSLTVVLTLSIAGSAASLFWVLRRWGASRAGAALGGALYGFSPAVVNSGIGHYNFAFAVLPPLIIHAGLRTITGRGNPVRSGALLGLLLAMQVFIGEELLADTAVAGLVLAAAVVLSQPLAVPGRVRDCALGAGTAAAVALLIAGHALWVQFRGPLHEHAVLTGSSSGNLALFVEPSASMLFHSPSSAAFVIRHSISYNLAEALAYLGWPLIVTLLAAGIWYWRDPKVRAAAITWAVVELCSLGGGPLHIDGFRLSGSFLPYHWLQGLPAMAELLPQRFCIVGAGAAGAVLAFALDRARSAAPPQPGFAGGVPADPGSLPRDPSPAAPVRLAGRLRPAAARAQCPGAGRPRGIAAALGDRALAGRHRRAWLADRRVLPRARRDRSAGVRHQPGAVPRRENQPALVWTGIVRFPRAGAAGAAVLAARGGGSAHAEDLASGPVPDQPARPAFVPGWVDPGLEAVATASWDGGRAPSERLRART